MYAQRSDRHVVVSAGQALVVLTAAVMIACHKAPPPGSEQAADAASSAQPSSQSAMVEANPPAAPGTALVAQPAAPAAVQVTAPPAAAQATTPSTVVIPAGTRLTVRLEGALGSATSAVGESFNATLVSSPSVDGFSRVARHTSVVGKVVDAKAAGKFAGGASLALRLVSVAEHAVVTSTYNRRIEGKGGRTAAVIGGTSAAGALLGALAGHGRGAAIGALVGGGVGTLGAAETGNGRDIILPPGTVLTFKLLQSISLP